MCTRKVFYFCIDEAACEALTDMPPRSEEELDAVTLHNQGLMNMESNPTQGFEKFQFLLQQNPFPPETFGNLLLLYIKYEVFSVMSVRCSVRGGAVRRYPGDHYS